MVDVRYYEAAVEMMDNEIREAMHAEGEWTTDEAFLREYERRHMEKYGAEFEI